ncbi:hypothetical protein Tco_0349749 [Tanacetum coccineum]
MIVVGEGLDERRGEGTDMSKITENSQETRQKRTRERMSDQEAKDLKAEAREIMPQLYLSKTKAQLQ